MIQLEEVRKTYQRRKQKITALDHLSMKIEKGEYVSIIGPSGSGKSTLLLMLGGMLSPTEGRVIIDGESLYDLSADERAGFRRKKLGFVFQTFNLIPYLTALQNVQIPLLISGKSPEEQEEKAKQLLTKVGLGERMEHKPTELSIGQQQRVALARTLANEPDIILADEPTGNLDPAMSAQMMSFLTELNKEGKTIVIVTHDMKVSEQTKRTIIIEASN